MTPRTITWDTLVSPITTLSSVGSRYAARLQKLGIRTLRDLLWHVPNRYEDFSAALPIRSVEPGQKVNIQGEVVGISSKNIFPRRMVITTATIVDNSGSIKATWFNQPYIADALAIGTLVSLAGKVALRKGGLVLSNPSYEKISSDSQELRHTQGLVPVYPETAGVSSKYLRFLIQPLLEQITLEDPLPKELRTRHELPDIGTALRELHYPSAYDQVEQARRRLAFDDLLLFQLKALLTRRTLQQVRGISFPFEPTYLKHIVQKLPFTLTKDQRVAAFEIVKDLEKSYPMNRLLEGDVGSGKTIVAALAAAHVAQHKFQTAFLVPTEVLAMQHYQTLQNFLQQEPLRIGLSTGTVAYLQGQRVAKATLVAEIRKGSVDIVLGTHALLQKDVRFKNLALVVVDEQHRFGIDQRKALLVSKDAETKVPHLLSMTATPIPRTLALTMFGDLDISILREKPKNRKRIITELVSQSQRPITHDFIREQVRDGRQVMVICPRIEVSTPDTAVVSSAQQIKLNLMWAEVRAVEEEFKKLTAEFSDCRVGMLHGKLKPKDKERIMHEFKDGWIDILVSTSVIEVGVDVPNASVMMIESAERFGLAQLHQFRGRVGRGEHQSYCFLLTSTNDPSLHKRLRALAETDDGFALAEQDLLLRGPGQFFGTKQSGLPDLAMASLVNVDLIKRARAEAQAFMKQDPTLQKYPLLRQQLDLLQTITHFE